MMEDLACFAHGIGRIGSSGGFALEKNRLCRSSNTPCILAHPLNMKTESLPKNQRLGNMIDFRKAETLFFDPRGLPGPVETNVVFAYPNEYTVGICSLGYQVVWAALSAVPGAHVSRLFTDAMDDLPLTMDLLGFSMSWELDYTGVFAQFEFTGVPRRSVERGEDDPLVFGGGPVLTANPEPFADFFDIILLGDGENLIPEFVKEYQKCKGLPRNEILCKLAKVPGVYVPSLYVVEYESKTGPIKSIQACDADIPVAVKKATYQGPSLASSTVVSPKMAWENIYMVEAVRSCPTMCRFCLASYITLPFRSPSIENALVPTIDRGLTATNRIGILGASVTQHPHFDDLLTILGGDKYDGVRLSLSSVRTNTVTPKLIQTLVKRDSKSITIAIESGSERLRQIINKKLKNEAIIEAAECASAGGLSSLKLYGMSGLPGEIPEDHEETIKMFEEMRKTIKGSRLRLSLGCSTFVPKAHTPFQWFGVRKDSEKTLKALQKRLVKLGIEFRPESYKWSVVQALISRGDRRISLILETVSNYGDSLGSFRRAFKDLKGTLPPMDFYTTEDYPIGAVLPWSHLQTSVGAERILSDRFDAEKSFRTDSPEFLRTVASQNLAQVP